MRRITISQGHKLLDAYEVESWAEGRTATLGRSDRVTWSYPHFDEISRHHLSIRKHGDDFYLRDEATVNGTLADDVPLQHVVRMQAGVNYRVGRLLVRYEGDPAMESAEPLDCDSVFPEEYGFAMMIELIAEPVKAAVDTRAKRVRIRLRAKRGKRNRRVKDRIVQMRQRLRLSVTAALICLTLIAIIAVTLYTRKLFKSSPPLASFELTHVAEGEKEQKKEKPRERETRITQSSPPLSSISAPIIVSPTTQAMNLSPSDMGEGIPYGLTAMGDGEGFGGDGSDGGSGDGGAGLGSSDEIASAFVGEFWDLKRSRNKSKSKYYPAEKSPDVHRFLSSFFKHGWQRSRFAPFLKSPVNLYATCFYMPNASDLEATHAYDPAGKYGLEKSRWVIIYRAQVQAPKTGRFRFIGAADSVMGVRFNRKNVLNVGLHNLNTGQWGDSDIYDGKHPKYLYKSTEVWSELCQGFTAGDIFSVRQGEWYDMEVLISEIGGGNFGFCLLIDELIEGESASMKMTEGGVGWGETVSKRVPVFQLFRTQLVEPDAEEIYGTMMYSEDAERIDPEYDEDSYVWAARTQQQSAR